MSDNGTKYRPDLVKSPGQLLRETLEDMEVDPRDFLETAGIEESYFASFMAGKAPLSDELASRLERWAKIPAWLWKRYERRWQSYLERKKG